MSLDEFRGRVWAFRELLRPIDRGDAKQDDTLKVVRCKIRMDVDRAGWNVPAHDPDAHLGAERE